MRNRRGSIFEAVVTDGHGQADADVLRPRAGRTGGSASSRRGCTACSPARCPASAASASSPTPTTSCSGGRRPAHRAAEFAAELIPIYPASQGHRLLADRRLGPGRARRAGRRATRCRARSGRARPAAATPTRCAASTGRSTAATRTGATARLKWDEAFVLQVVLAQRRRVAAEYVARRRGRGAPAGCSTPSTRRLPFELTVGQRAGRRRDRRPSWPSTTRCTGCCRARSARARPWSRCGRCCRSSTRPGRPRCWPRPRCSPSSTTGRSAELLGPLAEAGQLGGAEHATRVALLTGSLGAAARRRALLEAASGAAGIVIGTHALLEEQVQFADLGLVVIDEQHRFGVEQRDALRAKAGRAGRTCWS